MMAKGSNANELLKCVQKASRDRRTQTSPLFFLLLLLSFDISPDVLGCVLLR